MVRKCASVVMGLALVLTLGFAMAHANCLKVPGASISFSTPCVPAAPAFKVVGESHAAWTIESTCAIENTVPAAGVVLRSASEAFARAIRPPTPQAFAPMWHRPPPADS